MSVRWRIISNSFIRRYSQSSTPTSTGSQKPASHINADVPGLSEAVVAKATEPVGPGVDPAKSGPYKVPEYFCYNDMSYYEAEIEMSKHRLPQPTAPRKD